MKLSLCLISQAPHHEDVWESKVIAPHSWRQWSASCSCCFALSERAPDVHWIGVWEDAKASMNTGKSLVCFGNWTVAIQSVAHCYSESAEEPSVTGASFLYTSKVHMANMSVLLMVEFKSTKYILHWQTKFCGSWSVGAYNTV
jgi:hypothetical protein